MEQQQSLPRVLIFPLPAQGHVNSMLKLAELLGLAGLHVTFLNTHFIHNRLLLHADIQARFSNYPGFLFRTISDGLPDDHPRSSDSIMEMAHSINMKSKSLFKQMVASNELGSDSSPSVTCIIVDGIFGGFTTDVANELHIPIIHFRTVSACCVWAYFSIPNLIQAGELPIRGIIYYHNFQFLISFLHHSNTTHQQLKYFIRIEIYCPFIRLNIILLIGF